MPIAPVDQNTPKQSELRRVFPDRCKDPSGLAPLQRSAA